MAGHSKWANIKHKKGAADKKRGKLFSKLAKEIMVAAKTGGGDADTNPRLRTALVAAKSANVPNDNIDRAIKKGTGDLEGVEFQELIYEGYGPGGTALIVDVLTDNKNRSASDVRMTFDRNGGNLGNSGAVMWMFNRVAKFVVVGENADEEKLMDIVLEAGAEDIKVDGDVAEIFSPQEAFEDVLKALNDAEISTEEAGVVLHPENTVDITCEKEAAKILRIVDKFEDLDDVQNVYSNFSISDEVMEKMEEI